MRQHTAYVSELTRLLRSVIQSDPKVAESQRKGRAMFWDKRLDFEEQRRKAETELPMPGYPYANGMWQPRQRMARKPILPATE